MSLNQNQYEKLYVSQTGVIYTEQGRAVAAMITDPPHLWTEQASKDAARLVAYWNACIRLDTRAIEPKMIVVDGKLIDRASCIEKDGKIVAILNSDGVIEDV